jgi:hypothetical protein
LDHQERYLKGKLPSWKPKTDLKNMLIETKDCSLPLTFDSGDELNDQIMREIEEEYAKEKL